MESLIKSLPTAKQNTAVILLVAEAAAAEFVYIANDMLQQFAHMLVHEKLDEATANKLIACITQLQAAKKAADEAQTLMDGIAESFAAKQQMH
jgi:hypothetical protein